MAYGMTDDYVDALNLAQNLTEEQQFFVELKKVLFKLAKEKSKIYKAVFTVSYNPPHYKGCDSFNLTIINEEGFPTNSFKSTDLKDIVSELKSLQEPEYPDEITVKGRKYKLVEDGPKNE